MAILKCNCIVQIFFIIVSPFIIAELPLLVLILVLSHWFCNLLSKPRLDDLTKDPRTIDLLVLIMVKMASPIQL